MTRRDLLASTGAVAITALSQSRVLGANERLSIGLIGCGARSSQLQPYFQKLNGPVAAVCDLWKTRAIQAASQAPDATVFTDHRKLLEVPGLDAVVIATSDHWHARIAIDALNAGKDVYIEKPLGRTISEGQKILEAARVNNRICQVGAQQRSGTHYIQARDEYFKNGKLGKINFVRTWWADGMSGLPPTRPGAKSGGHAVPAGMNQKPADLDWNRYTAPVRWRAWDAPQYFNFRNYADLCGGILTDKYVHWVDVVHMFMQQDAPLTANAAGGLYVARDGRTVPDTLDVHYEYPGEWICTFSNIVPAGMDRDGIEFVGTQGHLRINRKKFEFYPAEYDARPVVVECRTDITEEHVNNFLECCRSRKQPNGDVLAGHRSATAAHLGNLSLIERRRIQFDAQRELVLPA